MEDSIAREVLERKKETLKSEVNFWQIVHHARKSELVGDEFVDDLQREGLILSTNTNGELIVKFLKGIAVRSGWFARFLSVLRDNPKHRLLAEQLDDGEFKFSFFPVIIVKMYTVDIMKYFIRWSWSNFEYSRVKNGNSAVCKFGHLVLRE